MAFKILKLASNTVSLIVASVTSVISLGLIMVSYSGYIDPELLPIAGVMGMTLPFWVPLMIVVFLVDAIRWHRSALIAGISLAVCIPQIVDVYPVGVGDVTSTIAAGRGNGTFTLLTYNCSGWIDLTGKYADGKNPTAKVILDADADIVCLQESDNLRPSKRLHLAKEQLDSIRARYPYIIETEWHLMLLSKYPASEIDLGLAGGDYNADETTAYQIDFGQDRRKLVIFSVHLQSIGLTQQDKTFYGEITRLDDENPAKGKTAEQERTLLNRVKNELIGKLCAANSRRASQIKRLLADVRRISHDNDVIVCGDFNDVPGCYSLHRLEGEGLRQVYPAVARGYMATFNRDKFWFRIDHVLWRGDILPLSMRRISTITSDHYPLVTTFSFIK